MRFLVWLLRLIVFVLVLMFAMNITGPVNVHFYADYMIPGVPLIVVMLAMLILVIVLALLASDPAALRSRRRSEERCAGTECGSTCRSRWYTFHSNKNTLKNNRN